MPRNADKSIVFQAFLPIAGRGDIPYTARMANTPSEMDCLFCRETGGDVLFEDDLFRVVLVGDDEGAAFPGFCRVISHRHVREITDLEPVAQRRMFDLVMATERAVRATQRPHKINLASLGNLTPHVHWHVIPRWEDDSHFPAPIWAVPQRAGAAHSVDGGVLKARLIAEIGRGGA